MSYAIIATQELERLLEGAVLIARRAGAEISEVYAGSVEASRKSDDSPLTEADLRAHRAIVAGLAELTPDLPVLSEEGSSVGWETRSQWSRYWLVDPLDGTKEFLARNGEFTVNLALIVDHEPRVGVVYAPATDTLYTGVVGLGAWRSDGGAEPRPIHARTPAAAPCRVVGSRSHGGGSLDALLARLGPNQLIARGSSLKLCLVAEGAADLYPRLAPTSEWDIAAGQAVVVAAGGQVVTLDGAALRYNTKADLLNPSFLVYGDAGRDWLALAR